MQNPTDPADRTGTIGVEAFDAAYGVCFQASDDSPHAVECELVTDHRDGWRWEPYAVDGSDVEAARQQRSSRSTLYGRAIGREEFAPGSDPWAGRQ